MAISGFPISGGALSSTGGATGAPPLGSLSPPHIFDETEIKFRFGERYTSDAANKKFLGIPRGVYMGFTPAMSGGVLTLSPDATYGVSFARVTSSDPASGGVPYALDVVTKTAFSLDFSGHTAFPAYVCLRAFGELGESHSAEVYTQIAYPNQRTEILLCKVTDADTVAYDAPLNRSTPYAYTNAPLGYGFMPGGTAEELLDAINILTELEDARVDLEGVAHEPPPPEDGLAERLDVDAAGPAIAGRLGSETRTIISEVHTLTGDESVTNVSKSFAALYRTVAPLEDIEGFGSESRLGAITDGDLPTPPPTGAASDDDRNLCAVIDATSERRIEGVVDTPIFGRLAYHSIELVGTLNFSTTTVTGVGTQFVTQEIEAGDLIEAPDGNFYEVAVTPVSETSLTLSTSAGTQSGTDLVLRRFLLSFLTRAAVGEENSVVLPLGTSFKFFFTLWRTVESSQFDYLPYLFRNFDSVPVIDATTSQEGKVRLASGAPNAEAGALYAARDTNVDVGDGNFHTVNFEGATVGASTGIVNVTQRGPTGDPGDDAEDLGVVGPQGPDGPRGIGFDVSVPYLFLVTLTIINQPGYQWSATVDTTPYIGSSRELRFINAGFSQWGLPWQDDADDYCQITTLQKTGPRTFFIEVTAALGGPHVRVSLFANFAASDIVTWGT